MTFNNIHKVILVLMTCFSLVFSQTYTINNTQSTSSRFVNNGVNNINASDINDLCTSYPTTGICSNYIDYSIYINGTSISRLEQQLTYLVNISHGFNRIAPTCVDAYYRYACSFTYPKCDNNEPKMGCMSACDDVYHTCSKIFELAGISRLPNCNQTSPLTGLTLSSSSATCNSIPPKVTNPNAYYNLSAVPANFIAATCPSPFIKDLDPSSSSESLCLAGCCMPCPSQNFFYPTGWTRRGFKATTILRVISSVLCLFMAISYLVLPDKRRHPSLLILNFSTALFIFSLVGFFSVGDPTRIQCASRTTSSTQDNNPLCAVQGALLIFGSLATCCWSAALILNLHLHTVWRSNFFSDRYDILSAFCWGYPAIIMSVILGLHKVKFEFADLCLVSMDAIFETFFYPMIAVICPAFLVHLATFVYIARMAFQESTRSETRHSTQSDPAGITTRTHKHVLVAVKIQWRALLLAVLAISAVVFYWIFYFTQINKMKTLVKDNSIKLNWIECMISPDGSQDNCTDVIQDYLPPFGVMIAAEAYVSSLGIWLTIIFGRMSLFRDWNDLLYDLRLFFTSRGPLKARNEQFFAL